MKAFLEKDWQTAANDFNKGIKKMKRKVGLEKRHSEMYVFCAVANLNLKSNKATQVFSWLKKAFDLDRDHTIGSVAFAVSGFCKH